MHLCKYLNLWVAKGCSDPQRDMGCGSTQGMCGIPREVHPSKVPHEPNTSLLDGRKTKPPSSRLKCLNFSFRGLARLILETTLEMFILYFYISRMAIIFRACQATVLYHSAGMRLSNLYFTLIEPVHHAILHIDWLR